MLGDDFDSIRGNIYDVLPIVLHQKKESDKQQFC